MKKTLVVVGLALLLAACSAPEETPVPEVPEVPGVVEGPPRTSKGRPQYVPDQVLVKFKEGVGVSSVVGALGFEVIQELSGGELLLKLPTQAAAVGGPSVTEVVAQLKARADVEYAQPNYLYYPQKVPNDTFYPLQWHYPEINLPSAWDLTTGKSSVRIAVLDTGSTPHPDMNGQWLGGYDFVSDLENSADGNGRDSNPADPGDLWLSFHGTHVAGTIAALSNNRSGVAGVCWSCKVVPVRVLGYEYGTTADIVDAIRWASGIPVSGVPNNRNAAQVINLSLGHSLGDGTCASDDVVTQNAINAAVARNVTVVVAAGNSGDDAQYYSPASCDNVITVAATKPYAASRDWALTDYSNYGDYVDIAAPGGNIEFIYDSDEEVYYLVDDTKDGYADGVLSTSIYLNYKMPPVYHYVFNQGTSMAAPHVAGVVGLMLSRNARLTPAQVLTKLTNTATEIWCDGVCGAGLVNARLAVQ